MACPTCGGSSREPIAPGFWRCTSPRTKAWETGGPGLTNPLLAGQPGVIRHEETVVCDAEYQEGPGGGGETCACGRDSIGICVECHARVCGLHSQIWKGRRLCDEDLVQAQAVAQARNAEAAAKEADAAVRRVIQAWDDWLIESRRSLAESEDATERVVRVVALLHGGAPSARRSGHETEAASIPPVLLSQGFPNDTASGWWWDHEAVQSWFLRNVKAPPQQLGVVRVRRGPFGKRKETLEAGWAFPNGSTVAVDEYATSRWGYLTVSVLANGDRLLGASPDDPCGFNERAVAEMAVMAKLSPLPSLPSMSFNHPVTRDPIWPVK